MRTHYARMLRRTLVVCCVVVLTGVPEAAPEPNTTGAAEPARSTFAPHWTEVPPGPQADGWRKFKSTHCVACHDGILAPDRGARMQRAYYAQPLARARKVAGHRVGMEYPRCSAAWLRSARAVIPETPLRVKDLLVAGRVECVSCHAYHAHDALPGTALIRREFRVVPGDLCSACHQWR